MPIADFAPRLLRWFDAHGRHDLPWQHPRTPYRVWLSEIMLQQTQVSTVIPYFHAFLQRFPTLRDLAQADEDAVMAAWAGLGYYSRARNLHATAKRCVQSHHGELPPNFEELNALPGIGRSTAGAILAQAFDLPHPILDGNVKRVLTRLHGIETFPGESAVERELWALSESLLPESRLPDYTQALMDFGATLCTRNKPRCDACPFRDDCIAHSDGKTASIPARKPKRDYPLRRCVMLVVRDAQERVFLEKRPPQGIWAGLWCLPQADSADALALPFGIPQDILRNAQALATVKHKFTHFHLDIQPLLLREPTPSCGMRDNPDRRWQPLHALDEIGLPAPVRKLLDGLPC